MGSWPGIRLPHRLSCFKSLGRHDCEMRRFGELPSLWRIDPTDTPSRIGIFNLRDTIPYDAAGIDQIPQHAVAALVATVQRGSTPQPPSRRRYPLAVEVCADFLWADAIDVVMKYTAYGVRFRLNNLKLSRPTRDGAIAIRAAASLKAMVIAQDQQRLRIIEIDVRKKLRAIL